MGDKKSTRSAALCTEMAKRIVTALSARALWAAIVHRVHPEM
ncbi:hypothetical protein ACH4PU_29330 [Streptomyces sp. NPDC021100]